jgi:hypothetical protein
MIRVNKFYTSVEQLEQITEVIKKYMYFNKTAASMSYTNETVTKILEEVKLVAPNANEGFVYRMLRKIREDFMKMNNEFQFIGEKSRAKKVVDEMAKNIIV